MTYSTTVTYTGHIPKMPQRKLNTILRESYKDVGQVFFDKNLPRRFTVYGSRLLSYSKRSPSYTRRKERLFGHKLPLVYSGRTRERALSASFTKIRAKSTKGQGSVVLTVNAPALNFKHPNGPNTRKEFERVSTVEIGPLERVLEKSVLSGFTTYNDTTTFKA